MKKNKTIIIISWLLVIFWMLIIFNFSAQAASESNEISSEVTKIVVETIEKVAPNTAEELSNHIIRKNAHFFIYLILGALVVNGTRVVGINKKKLIGFLICVIYAMGDEFHQYFVPGRGPGIKDVLIDSAGAMLGIMLYSVLFIGIYKVKDSLYKKEE